MPKFLLEANYTPEGLRGLLKDTATGRESRIKEMLTAAGGKLESMHFGIGKTDVFVICELPDLATCTALCMAVSASGVVQVRTTPLLTSAETDAAIRKGVIYRPPGS